jgi:Zn-dependent peptidase ImmA (M78 family)
MGTNYLTDDSPTSQGVPVSLNLEQATSLIVERAKQLVNQLIEQRGHDKPPFSPEEFARLLGFKIVKADLGETSAVLLRFHDGYIIKLNQKHNLARQNFSCAHEIGHNLLRELKIELNTENIEYRTFNPQAHALARAKARERLCEVAASELLMPEHIFRKYLLGFGVSIHAIERLADIFRVSIRAATLRIAEVSTEPCIALLWDSPPRTKSRALQLAWGAGPGRKVIGKDYYMPVHTRVAYPSTLHKAYENDRPVKSFKLFKLDNAVKRCPMESKGFGRGETRYVISLAFPNR